MHGQPDDNDYTDGAAGAAASAGDEDGRRDGVLVLEDANGALVVGDGDAVKAFVLQWQDDGRDVAYVAPVVGDDLGTAITTAVDLGAIAANVTAVAQYLRLRTAGKGETVVLRKWVQGAGGRIVSNSPISPADVAGLDPALTLGIIGVRFALAEATRNIVGAIEEVGARTDDLLRLVDASRVGDVHGHQRVLRRHVARLDGGAVLTETDWSTVAGLGPPLEVGVERLRHHAARLIQDLPSGLKPDDRAKHLGRIIRESSLGEVLRLLVVAEQSLYLWQRLRMEHARTAEPQHLAEVIEMAHAVLAEHLEADGELINDLCRTLQEYGVLRPLDFYRKLSGHRLHDNITSLRHDVEYFVTARGLQVEGWELSALPTTMDALKVITSAAAQSGRSVRGLGDKAIDSSLAGVSWTGRVMQTKADRRRSGQPGSRHNPPADRPTGNTD